MIFRKRVIFRVEETLPDPEEQKWGFRRKILLGTLLITLGILGIPVFQDRIPHLRTIKEARSLAETILATRLYATQHRVPVSLELDPSDRRSWVRTFHTGGDCSETETTPRQKIMLARSVWRVQPMSENLAAGKEIKSLCFHPWKGLLADGEPTDNLRIAVQGYPEEDIETSRTDRVAQVLLEHGGAALTILRN